ncbi:anthrone oxygenase family protein [Hoyosella subflava]|uniref:DUF1772 domain-containing protein n=1 Tax=Hoyosella subflava (strain DSM 45089 / JCM 17490 / NBRC 109087 / DQS3-9A1) TaxID=443218 RepID=F6EGI4_HOYSD|nr:anthrone oxygenase family protein [Hoyosella subflava]AEF41037.1 hypothetical protein AS9A_2590 [Hoyosella subflava DQS3-9A1]
MLDTAALIVLAFATFLTGLSAGLFFAYACSVMLALRSMPDRVFIDAMQRINSAIVNPWFLSVYIGSAFFIVVAVALVAISGAVGPAVAAGVALLMYATTMVITGRVNIPLNVELEAADPEDNAAHLRSARAHFEPRWVRFNLVRTATACAAAAALCLALALA